MATGSQWELQVLGTSEKSGPRYLEVTHPEMEDPKNQWPLENFVFELPRYLHVPSDAILLLQESRKARFTKHLQTESLTWKVP